VSVSFHRIGVPFVTVLALMAILPAKAQAVSVRWPQEAVQVEVRFDTAAHRVEGVARLTLPPKGPKSAGFLLNKDFTVTEATFAGEPLTLERLDDYDTTEVTEHYGTYGRWNPGRAAFYYGKLGKKQAKAKAPVILEVKFHGSLYRPPDNRQFSREKIAFEVDGTIGSEGIYLSAGALWYPRLPDAPCPTTITARLPKGWKCVTDGSVTSNKEEAAWVEITHESRTPSDGVNFSAAPWQLYGDEIDGVALEAYFLPAQAELARGYLDACKRYMQMYVRLIGPYPFPKFAVVDNFLPSGYGMPGWTLLGSEVIRLPFIKDVSLGHEVLHNWLGNSLLVDYRGGNWCEGLTTYLADYRYKADSDSLAAVEYRMNILRDYAGYVSAGSDYPLVEFTERENPRDRAIGYGKTAMVFHMLKGTLDREEPGNFEAMLRDAYKKNVWKPIAWKTWREQSERQSGQRLDWFFEQWIEWQGAPEISIGEARLEEEEGSWRLVMEVVTRGEGKRPYMYFLPVRGISDEGRVDYTVFIQESPQKIVVGGPGSAEAVVLDPGFDLFRKVYPGETPLTFASFFGDKEGLLVVPSQGKNAESYRKAAEGLKSEGQKVLTDAEYRAIQEARQAPQSLWIFGSPAENFLCRDYPDDDTRLEFLPGREPRWKEDKPVPEGFNFRGEMFRGGAMTATLIGWHPSATGKKCIVRTVTLPYGDPVAGTRKLPHYGKYSYLLFEGDTNVQKGVWAAAGESPMVWRR